MTFSAATTDLAARLIDKARTAGVMLATVESCTGGLIAGAVTAVSGSSDVLDRGFVTYANAAKTEIAGVPAALIETHGAVSEEVARAMAEGVLEKNAGVGAAVSVTGVAGPGGGTAEKPVGLVHMAAARRGAGTLHERHQFAGDRDAVRMQTVDAALALLARALD